MKKFYLQKGAVLPSSIQWCRSASTSTDPAVLAPLSAVPSPSFPSASHSSPPAAVPLCLPLLSSGRRSPLPPTPPHRPPLTGKFPSSPPFTGKSPSSLPFTD